jgi:hypothetical protein
MIYLLVCHKWGISTLLISRRIVYAEKETTFCLKRKNIRIFSERRSDYDRTRDKAAGGDI